mgnify:CR=1 FL=1
MFLFENVRGLLSHDRGRTFDTIKHTFEGLGYAVQHRVLNACYFGVGQKRERLIVIGIRNDLADKVVFEYPEPDKKQTMLRDVLQNVPDSPYQPYSEKKRKVMALVLPADAGWTCPTMWRENIWAKAISPAEAAVGWRVVSLGMSRV